MEKELIKSSLSNVTLSAEPGKMIITGCVAKIGEASTGAPCGAMGRKVVFTEESIAKCGKTFEGMPLNCTFPEPYTDYSYEGVFTGHGDTNIGFLRKVKAKGNDLIAEMVIWKDKFPEQANLFVYAMDALGFSCEWYNTATHDEVVGKETYTYIDEFEGAGCAILWKDAAAFNQTFIEKLAASKEQERNDDSMTNEEKQELIKEMVSAMSEVVDTKVKEVMEKVEANKVDIAPLQEKVELISAEIEKNGKAFEDYVLAQVEKEQAKVEAAKEVEVEQEEKIEASVEEKKDIPVPTAVQHIEPNPNVGDKVSELDKIYASDKMSPIEKLRAITKARM